MGTDILDPYGALAYPSWVGLLTGATKPHVALEDLVNEALADATSADEVRELVADLVDDEAALKLYHEIAAAVTEEAMDAVLAHDVAEPADRFGAPDLEDKWRRAWRLAATRIPLFRLVVKRLGELESTPTLVLDAARHPDVTAMALNLSMATVAGIGLSSHSRRPLSRVVLDSLLDICIEGERGHYAYLVPLAAALKLDARVDHGLLPDGVMDLNRLATEFRTAAKNHEQMLDRARRSGLPVYPPPRDG